MPPGQANESTIPSHSPARRTPDADRVAPVEAAPVNPEGALAPKPRRGRVDQRLGCTDPGPGGPGAESEFESVGLLVSSWDVLGGLSEDLRDAIARTGADKRTSDGAI